MDSSAALCVLLCVPLPQPNRLNITFVNSWLQLYCRLFHYQWNHCTKVTLYISIASMYLSGQRMACTDICGRFNVHHNSFGRMDSMHCCPKIHECSIILQNSQLSCPTRHKELLICFPSMSWNCFHVLLCKLHVGMMLALAVCNVIYIKNSWSMIFWYVSTSKFDIHTFEVLWGLSWNMYLSSLVAMVL